MRYGYRAIVFKGIEDLFKAVDIEIHSNVYNIRTSTPKEKTYISKVEYLVKKENSLLNLFSHSVSEVPLSLSLCRKNRKLQCQAANPYLLLSLMFPQTKQKHLLCTITSFQKRVLSWVSNSNSNRRRSEVKWLVQASEPITVQWQQWKVINFLGDKQLRWILITLSFH